MKYILDLLTKNKIGLSIVGFILAGFIAAAGLNGCKITDFVKVRVPVEVQRVTGSPSKVILTDAPDLLKEYAREFKRGGEKFVKEIARGYAWVGFISAISTTSLELGKSTIPGGAVGLSALSLIAGIFIKGPGTAKEKNASFNKGLSEGQSIAKKVFKDLAGIVKDGVS